MGFLYIVFIQLSPVTSAPASRVVAFGEEHVKTAENTAEISFHPGGTGLWGQKRRRSVSAPEKNRGADWKKVLANLWRWKRITKMARAGRGQEIKWEIPSTVMADFPSGNRVVLYEYVYFYEKARSSS